MKNNKGFSILELIVSFSLTMVIVVILLEIIIAMKDVYEKSVTKTALLNKQNLITDAIYTDIDNYGLYNVNSCGNNCLSFYYDNGSITKELSWDITNLTVKYGDYNYELINGSKFNDQIRVTSGSNTLDGVDIIQESNYTEANVDSYINIHLPIYHQMFKDEDFGINLIHTYGSKDSMLALSFSASADTLKYKIENKTDQIVKNVKVNGDTVNKVIGIKISKATAMNNYVWFSGQLWQVVETNDSWHTIKLVTANSLTSIAYGTTNTWSTSWARK